MTDQHTHDYYDYSDTDGVLSEVEAERLIEAMATAFVAGVRASETGRTEKESALAFAGSVLQAEPTTELALGQRHAKTCALAWKGAWERMGYVPRVAENSGGKARKARKGRGGGR